MNCLFLLLLLSCWGNGFGNCGLSNSCCDDDCDNGCNNAREEGRGNNCECEDQRENCDNSRGNNRGNNRGNDCDCATPFSVNTPPRRPRTENMTRGRDDDFDCGCDDNRREPRVFPPYPGENCGCDD